MSHTNQLPQANCHIEVEPLGPTKDFDLVKGWLPPKNATGWVMFADRVELFDPARPPTHRFLAAEIAVGEPTSIHIRFDGRVWSGWRYTSRPGETHFAEKPSEFLAVEGAHVKAPSKTMQYQRIWSCLPAPGQSGAAAIPVWTPWVTRFVGFSKSNTEETE